jgi:riboflavin kinase
VRPDIGTLKSLALRGAHRGYVHVSTGELGAEMGVSQQTASNRLVALAAAGLIKRRRSQRGQDLALTKAGISLLRKELADYQRVFGGSGVITIKGTVSSGLGEGQYYLNKPGYKDQIKSKLGFAPYKGTLNVAVSEPEMAKLDMVPQDSRIRLDSFRADGRTYGEAECIPVSLGKVRCAIILPKRSHHESVLEIIAAEHLRTKLGLADGDAVEIAVEG